MNDMISEIVESFLANIASVNYKYDKAEQPRRFYRLFFTCMVPFLLLDIIGLISGSVFFNICALLWIVFILNGRLWWIRKDRSKYLYFD